jgi:hypothetical protein
MKQKGGGTKSKERKSETNWDSNPLATVVSFTISISHLLCDENK